MKGDPLLGRCLLRSLAVACLIAAAAGCGSGFKTVPVGGKVLVDGKPLAGADATVLFRPDPSKGNTLNLDFAGSVDEEGNYTLYHGNSNRGAAPGWYKIAVVATEQLEVRKPPSTPEEKRRFRPGPSAHFRKSMIDTKYNLPTSSGIEIEVVENPAPGAYDLKLTGPATR